MTEVKRMHVLLTSSKHSALQVAVYWKVGALGGMTIRGMTGTETASPPAS